MPKLITVRSYDPIAIDRKCRQPWSDVWISFTGKPGRKKYKFGPTLVAFPALIQDVELARYFSKADQIADCEKILKSLAVNGDLYIETIHSGLAYPSIYTSRKYIDRAEAERMIGFFMRTLGFASCRFKWLRAKFTMVPTLI